MVSINGTSAHFAKLIRVVPTAHFAPVAAELFGAPCDRAVATLSSPVPHVAASLLAGERRGIGNVPHLVETVEVAPSVTASQRRRKRSTFANNGASSSGISSTAKYSATMLADS
jgi:hypothetical protein